MSSPPARLNRYATCPRSLVPEVPTENRHTCRYKLFTLVSNSACERHRLSHYFDSFIMTLIVLNVVMVPDKLTAELYKLDMHVIDLTSDLWRPVVLKRSKGCGQVDLLELAF